MIPRCNVGAGITGAVRYVLGEGRDPTTGRSRNLSGGEKSRVTWFGGTGFGFQIVTGADADLARRVMEFDAQNQASRTRLCIKDCVHLSLGWRPGQTPTVEEMEAAALDALTAIGMGNARALFAIHCDEAYAHIHIVASKINPATGRAYDLKGNYLKLSQWAESYERAHGGVICTARQESNELRDAIRARDVLGVLAQITKQRATFTERDLDRILAKEIKATGTRTAFARKILAIPDVVSLSDEPDGETCRFSTRSILDAEGYVLRAAQGLARQRDHNIGRRIIASVLSRPAFLGMTGEQRQAMHHALGPDGLAIIDGRAGTGKSFTLAAIREAYEASGCQVIGLAPTNAVAQDMARDGFRRAGTIHSELFALNNGRTVWTPRSVIILDEAAMVDTKLMAMVTAHAFHAGAKLILVGDDRQLSSIDHGGMFGTLKERYGATQLTSVRRQVKDDDRRATELMAEGNFHEALERYEAKEAIHWTTSQDAARAALVRRWAEDTAQDPEGSRFVFAYTNLDVDDLNRDLRQIRQARGELGEAHEFETKHGRHAFAVGDRLQFTGTNKPLGIFNGNSGVIERIEGEEITVRLDGSDNRRLSFDAAAFDEYRHGYAGTIYKGQGRTIDQTYLYHSAHWRSAASYVALSRHRQKTELFVARDVARDLNQLARQMGRVEERRAASQFFLAGEQPGPVRPMTPSELLAQLAEYAPEWRMRLPVKHAFSGGRAQARRQNYAALRNAVGVAPGPSEAEPELTPGGSREIGKATRTGAVTPKSMLTAWRQLASWLTRRIVVSLRPVLKRRRPVTSHDR